MNAETLVIISNICFLLLYCNDYFLLCKIFYYLHEMKKINDNRRENILFLFPRILIFISNTCTMYYCVLHLFSFQTPFFTAKKTRKLVKSIVGITPTMVQLFRLRVQP